MKKVLSGMLVVLLLLGLMTVMPVWADETVTLGSDADTYVNNGQGGTNYGTVGQMVLINGARFGFVRFKIPDPYIGRAIKSANLVLTQSKGGTGVGNGTVYIQYVGKDDWIESGTGSLTYNIYNANISSFNVSSAIIASAATTQTAGHTLGFDLTKQFQLESDNCLSFMITSSSGKNPEIATKENTTSGYPPVLTLTFAEVGSDDEKEILDYKALDLVMANPGIDLSNIVSNGTLVLPTTGSNGSTIQWASDTPDVISSEGVIQQPTGTQPATVKLTATITKGSYTPMTKDFTAVVKPYLTPDQAVAADLNSLSLSYNGTDVTITLPTAGANGTTISWASDNAAINIDNGTATVTREIFTDVPVTLTATVAKSGAIPQSKDFSVTVKQLGYIMPEADVDANSGQADTNSGSSTKMTVGSGREGYLRFDLSAIPNRSMIKSATLKLVQIGGNSSGSGNTLTVKRVDNDTWNESDVTYNHRPMPGNIVVENATINGNSVGNITSIDLTNAVRDEVDNKLGIDIAKSVSGASGTDFASKENTSYSTPQLAITFTDSTADADLISAINDRNELNLAILRYDGTTSPQITLPISGSQGSSIAWTMNGSTVDASTPISLPTTDQKVNLVATLTKNLATVTKAFTVSIYTASYTVESAINWQGKVSVEITKNIQSENTGKLYIAIYDPTQNQLIGVKEYIPDTQMYELSDTYSTNATVKALIWDDSLRPLAK